MGVMVSTGARLHFGLLTAGNKSGRQYGGLGVMVQEPSCEVIVSSAERDLVIADMAWHHRVQRILERCREILTPASHLGVQVELRRIPPAHCGFGSGTQVALAVATGFCATQGIEVPRASVLADVTERGGRSAIGIHGFEMGGLLLEAGKLPGQKIGALVSRTAFPVEWRWILLRPRYDAGVSGGDELAAFSGLPPMSEAMTDRLCGIALREIVPAASERRFAEFALALWEYGNLVGEYFSPAQGGVFAHPLMRQLAGRLREMGEIGIAQTSWGPTLALVQPSAEAAADCIDWIRRDLIGMQCEVMLTQALNRGAILGETVDGDLNRA